MHDEFQWSLQGAKGLVNFSGELRHALSMPWEEQGRAVLESLYGADASPQDELFKVARGTLGLLGRVEAKLPRAEGRVQA